MRVERIGECACGCGGDMFYQSHHKYYGVPKYLPGHSSRISPYWQGKKLTKEHVKKLSESHKGHKLTEEQKGKIADANRGPKNHNYGKTIPLASRIKMAKAKGIDKYIVDDTERAKEKSRRANKIRRGTPKGKLRHSLSESIRQSLRNGKEGKALSTLLPYSIDQLKKHLEKKFKPDMVWDNYGEWHVDHIIPISAFNFKTPYDVDFKRCWSLENLQPMWAIDNFKKGDRLNRQFQPSLRLSYAN